ncbi:MAG TPA: hypothetical protein V6C97_14585 [Oculatellaceae cyanobacterium]
MKISRLLLPAATLLLVSPPVLAQGFLESANMDAMSVGLGAGLAASLGRGALVGRTYQTAADAQMSAAQALQVQTKAIQQYMKLGCQYEAKKQWQNAEKSFRYVMQVSTMRDGVGSPKMVPTLQHLVHVSEAQGNIFDAIGFQQRVLQFAKNEKIPDPITVISEEIRLSNLYLSQQDYQHAEAQAEDSYVRAKAANTTLPKEKRLVVLKTYAELLRKMKKDAQAAGIEQELSVEKEEQANQQANQQANIAAKKTAESNSAGSASSAGSAGSASSAGSAGSFNSPNSADMTAANKPVDGSNTAKVDATEEPVASANSSSHSSSSAPPTSTHAP